MQRLNSITHAIPLTAQTDPNKFPRGDYQPYPRMMVTMEGKPFFDATGRIPVIVQNEDEETDFRAAHPGEVRDNVPNAGDMQDELTKLRAENARLKAQQEGGAKGIGVSSLVHPDDKPHADSDDASPPARPAARPAAQAAARRRPPSKLD